VAFDYGYAVQKYWSEQAQTSVAPGGVSWTEGITSIAQELPGQYFTLHSIQNGVTNAYNLQINYQVQNPGGNPAQGTFTGQWGTTSVHGTLSIDNPLSTTVHVQVYSDSTGSLLFDGYYTAPDGNWNTLNGLEMWGMVYQSGLLFDPYSYGTGQYGAGPTQGGTSSGGGGGGGGFPRGSHPPIVFQ
jgi:hypothetical protein